MRNKARRTPWTKTVSRFINHWFGFARQQVIRVSPLWLRRFFAPIYDYFDMIVIDHGFFRFFYSNRFKISDQVWRAAQPWPYQIRRMAKKEGIRTIVNLRGERDCGSYRLEKKICEKLDINLVDGLKLFSRAAPKKQTILEFKSHFDTLEYPLMMHCKSGADRMGLASVLYLHLIDGVPIEQAKNQLSLKYGHIKQANTGILDEFFQQYLEYAADHDISFIDWVETVYDEHLLEATYHSQTWANALVDKILLRE